MRFLLDTHVLAWWLFDDAKLRAGPASAIADPENEILVSAISAFEVTTKYRLGKWPEMATLVTDFEVIVMAERFSFLPIATTHALLAGRLPGEHKDPFDRLLAAQAKLESLVLISADAALDSFGVERFW
jgi:PIN domain nuclease of toxin-antitoxin system